MKISLRQLELFVQIAQQNSVTKAAKAVFLSQSAASMALLELEKQLDTSLFDRSGKKLTLNSQGEYLFKMAKEIIERVQEIENFSKLTQQQLVGSLKIGASSTIGNYIFPEILNNFSNKNPQVKIKMQIGNTKNIIEKILRFEIDIGFIEGTCNIDEIKTIPWKRDELIFCVSPKHPLSKKKNLDFKDLQQPFWILREEGSGTRQVFQKAMNNYIAAEHIKLELGSTESIKEAVIAGMGISCLSGEAVKREIQAKEIKQLIFPHLKITRHFYKLIHQDKYQSSLILGFHKFVEDLKQDKGKSK